MNRETPLIAMKNQDILISGAGIAGPTLAYWLKRYGFNPTVVEKSPTPRQGGYIFGLDGKRGVEVLERMGLWPRVEQEKYEGYEYVFVDEADRPITRFDVGVLTQEITGRPIVYMRRANLARLLYECTRDSVEYIFGDSVRQLTEDANGAQVAFESGNNRQFDLVIGADGLHSDVRAITFGPEQRFKKYMGHYVAAYAIHDYPSQYGQVTFYTMPGKSVTLYHLKEGGVIAVFTFRHEQELTYDSQDTQRQKQILADIFSNKGWKVPELLEAMRTTSDFFFDVVSQIRMDAWFNGRIGLVGDAAYCPTLLTGYGSQLALVGAYILAGELKAAAGDYGTAFQAYERELRPFVEQKHKNIKLLRQVVPGTAFELWARNQVMKLMSIHAVALFMMKQTWGKVVAEESITLKDYEAVAN